MLSITITALDVFKMKIPADVQLEIVFDEGLIPDKILQEFVCQVAESILWAEHAAGRRTDKRSWAAIKAKRKWLRGKIDGDELYEVWKDAERAYCDMLSTYPNSGEQYRVKNVVWGKKYTVENVAWATVDDEKEAAEDVARVAWAKISMALAATWHTSEDGQIELLKKLIKEGSE